MYGIKNKAAISLTFDLHRKTIAALFFFSRIVVLFEDIAQVAIYTRSHSKAIHYAYTCSLSLLCCDSVKLKWHLHLQITH